MRRESGLCHDVGHRRAALACRRRTTSLRLEYACVTLTYTYPALYSWSAALAAVALAGYWHHALFRSSAPTRHRVLASLLTGLLLLYAPQLAVHGIQVDRTHLRVTGGYWWAPHAHAVRLDDIAAICVTSHASGRATQKVWLVSSRTPAPVETLESDLLRVHEKLLSDELRERGVVFACARGAPRQGGASAAADKATKHGHPSASWIRSPAGSTATIG